MAVMVSYEAFQDEFDRAKESLKDVDESIKKLTGRDPKLQRKRRGIENVNLGLNIKDKRRENSTNDAIRGRGFEDDRSGRKNGSSTFSRLGSREEKRRRRSDDEDEDFVNKPSVQSSVISNPNRLLIKSRRDSLIQLKSDKKVMDRNRRMFGLLMGTLQKFQTEQTQQKDKERKRQEIENKLEEAAVKEKEEVQKERRYLFLARRKKQELLRRLEHKMEIAKEHEDWEKQQKCYINFIKTKATPQIMYLPAKSSAVSIKRLGGSAGEILAEIEIRRMKMQEEIQELDKQDEIEAVVSDREDGKGNSINPSDITSKSTPEATNLSAAQVSTSSPQNETNDLSDITNRVENVENTTVANSTKDVPVHDSDVNLTEGRSPNEQEFEPMYD